MKVKNRLLNYSGYYIYQDTDFFKMSLDSVLLANFVTINLRDKNIIDLATGNAPIPMFLSFRTKAHIYGVELQKEIFDLGIKSVNENNMNEQIDLINADVNNLYSRFKSDFFDVITCNPPYFRTNNDAFVNNSLIKAKARHEKTLSFEDVCKISRYLLRTNGRLAIIHRTERLMEIVDIMKSYDIEPKKIRFVYPNHKKDSDLVLIEGVKGGRTGLKLLSPLFVYDKKDIYSDEVRSMFGE